MQQSSVVSFSNLGKIESYNHFPSAAVPATASEYPSHHHHHHHHHHQNLSHHPHSPVVVKAEYSPPPPSSVNMAKRALSDSDCDDLFSDTKDSCMTPPGSDTGASISRKKRRGIIEKRRRDRINNSLTELRRLVPTAFEKQGSAKLEKAEILQMTVDHLKMLHAKGLDALAYDPHKFAMDYHSIGFRECAAEVARYLVTVEGMDIQDPLRLRLMSHLQCFAAQRELANKQASASSWGLNPLTPNHSYPIPSHHHLTNSTNTGGLPVAPPLQPGQHPSLMEATSPTAANHGNYLGSSSNHTSPTMPSDPLGNNNNSNQLSASHPGGHHHANAMGASGNVHQRSPLFPPPSGGNPHLTSHHLSSREYSPSLGSAPQHATSNANPMTSTPYGMTQANSAYQVQAGNKPYRPWGAELAY